MKTSLTLTATDWRVIHLGLRFVRRQYPHVRTSQAWVIARSHKVENQVSRMPPAGRTAHTVTLDTSRQWDSLLAVLERYGDMTSRELARQLIATNRAAGEYDEMARSMSELKPRGKFIRPLAGDEIEQVEPEEVVG